jgi:signal peptidase I
MPEEKKSFLGILKKIWNFLWNEDSWLSWIAFIIVAFVVIKFIFFPLISFATGTSLPIVIVESCSMYHGENFDNWWQNNGGWYEERGITKEQFQSFYLTNGFAKGDIFFVTGVKKENIQLGNVIIFTSGNQNRPIIHRIVGLDPLETKGDHNSGQLSLEMSESVNPERIDETNISQNQIIGKVAGFKIPYLGWIKLIFFEPFRNPSERGFCR